MRRLLPWRVNPVCFTSANLIKNDTFRRELLEAWQGDNETLIDYINKMLITHRNQVAETWIDPPNYLSLVPDDSYLEPGIFTIGFARRFSTYKRADLIFDDIADLADILLKNNWKINFIFAGKAHPEDEPGNLSSNLFSISRKNYLFAVRAWRVLFSFQVMIWQLQK